VTVAIVGGGFAGLFTAIQLLEAGIDDLVVLESSDHPGGVAQTILRDGYVLEPAAGSFQLPHPHLSGMFGSDAIAAGARTRRVWDGRRLVTIPSGPRALLAPLVTGRAKLRALVEPLVSEPNGGSDESLDSFCRRRLGTKLGRTAAWLAASGVFAGDPTRLSAQAAFPALTGLVAAHGSILGGLAKTTRASAGHPTPSTWVPATTMSDLAGNLATRLGEDFRPGVTVDSVRWDRTRWIVDGSERLRADHVILACDPSTSARLVSGPLAEILSGSSAAPVVVVALGGPGLAIPEGFGILTGPDAGTATRGILLESSYAPHRAPEGHGLVKVIAGGHPESSVLDSDDSGVVERIGNEVATILGTDIDASFVEVARHRPGIPQYPVGHHSWLAAVEAATPPNLHLTGWGYRGVGLAHLATDASRIARTIAT
jgi:oxygen-dependent protoporphyrinogen oxidase